MARIVPNQLAIKIAARVVYASTGPAALLLRLWGVILRKRCLHLLVSSGRLVMRKLGGAAGQRFFCKCWFLILF
jgi:hypothetical protein